MVHTSAFAPSAPVARRHAPSRAAVSSRSAPTCSAPSPRRARASLASLAGAARGAALAAALVAAPLNVHALGLPATLFVDDAGGAVPRTTAAVAEATLQKVAAKTGFAVHFVVTQNLPFGETVDDYARELFEEWGGGARDVVVVGGTKIARAGVVAGDEAAKFLTKEIAASVGTETYALKAGAESYGSAVFDVNNRLAAVLSGAEDPGAPKEDEREATATYKTKAETKSNKGKYIKVVGTLLVISFVAPFIQTAWFLK